MPETINSIAASARHTGAEARFGLKPRGFTLIEVLVALSIMAVMAALTCGASLVPLMVMVMVLVPVALC